MFYFIFVIIKNIDIVHLGFLTIFFFNRLKNVKIRLKDNQHFNLSGTLGSLPLNPMVKGHPSKETLYK